MPSEDLFGSSIRLEFDKMLFNFATPYFLSRLYKFPIAQYDRIQTIFPSNEENLTMHQKPSTNATNQNGFFKIYPIEIHLAKIYLIHDHMPHSDIFH